MEIENDGSEVAREKPSNTTSFTVEDCLQAVNNSLSEHNQIAYVTYLKIIFSGVIIRVINSWRMIIDTI